MSSTSAAAATTSRTSSKASDSPEAVTHAIERTKTAVQSIRHKILPFLEELASDNQRTKRHSHSQTTTSLALAESAVALSLGTLQVIGARLQGKEVGKQADDPLRRQLNLCRSVLVKLQQRQKNDEKQSRESESTKKELRSGSKRTVEPSESAPRTTNATPSPAKKQKK